MSLINLNISRGISTSSFRYGKKNYDKFSFGNKRGNKLFKKTQSVKPDPDIPVEKFGVKNVGFNHGKKFKEIKAMIPELIVPNLEKFELKAYVSYKSENVVQSEFTAKDLFNAVYRKKIEEDFKNGKLDDSGNSLAPSEEEQLTPLEAARLASKPGSDIFTAPPAPLGTLIPTRPK